MKPFSIRNFRVAGIEFIQSFLNSGSSQGTRSTVMSSLSWLVGLLVAGCCALSFSHDSKEWMLVFMAVLLALSVTTYIAMFVYYSKTSSDSLRSETFTLSKLAIERSVRGDNLTGFSDPLSTPSAEALPPPKLPAKEPGDE